MRGQNIYMVSLRNKKIMRNYHQILPLIESSATDILGDPPRSKIGPGCSKLTTSLFNEPLKFQMLISQIGQYFWRKIVRSFCNAKASLIFSTKNFSVFGYKVPKNLTS